jgi:hypothetical protein
MTNGMNSLRTRLLNVASELINRKNQGQTYSEIALEVVKHHAFRRGLTHKIDSSKKGVLPTDAWVVIYQQEREDGLGREFTRSEPYTSEEQALGFLKQQWGDELDQSLIDIMLQRIVHQPKFEETAIEKAATSIKEYIETLVKHYADDAVYLGFPEGYSSKDDFLHHVEGKQNTQLDDILSVLNDRDSAGLIKKIGGGTRSVLTEQQWLDEHGIKKDESGNAVKSYPLNHIKNVELRVIKSQQVYTLIAVEEYLFFSEGDPLLFALAKSHSNLYEYYKASEVRDTLADDPNIGLWVGQENLAEEIKLMTATGFDFQPVFNRAKQCVGTIELRQVMLYLQNHEFGSLPQIIDRNELSAVGLLSPAPPIVDARLPLHRVNEIMYYGIGCVLVRYDPEHWTPEEQEFLNTHLKPGLHIFTKHDYVMSQTV